ncbi:MAG: 5-formyltetrahydrofolate cyclo-ligase [Candidatus Nitrosocaldus sp.]
MSKEQYRRLVWDTLVRENASLPPYPVHGRIPNFVNADKAASLLASTYEWKDARVIKVNPDSPQRWVRISALREGKVLIMPTPRIRDGFIMLDGVDAVRASTIKGALIHGKRLKSIDELLNHVKHVDLIVEGSVAVNVYGERLGKGEGYGELEFAILRELGVVDADVPIATTVHDLQVIDDRLPQDPYDVPIDIIATPTRLIRVDRIEHRPSGILWSMLSREKLMSIPILQELMNKGKRRL